MVKKHDDTKTDKAPSATSPPSAKGSDGHSTAIDDAISRIKTKFGEGAARELRRVAEKIITEYQPEKIILFGSWAWGVPHEWSDIDLFILKESNKRRLEREQELRLKLFGNKFPPLDLLIYTPKELEKRLSIEDFFIGDIVQKGTILYAR
jgi:predicted nucleotidyltransferase